MRAFTTEELDIIRAMAAAGGTRKETLKMIRIAPATFDEHCKRLGIVFYVQPHGEYSPRRAFTPEELDMVRRAVDAGMSKRRVFKMVRMGFDQFTRLCREHGISFTTPAKPPEPEKVDRPRRNHAAPKAARKNRNPMNILQEWKPPVAMTQLEEIVDALRTRFCPVHAEDTARYPEKVPHRYTEHSRFRVGGMRNVSVEELVRL